MDKKLRFLQSCVIQEINTDDLGYLTKWLFELGIDESFEKYRDKIQEFLDIKFFNQNNRIKDTLSKY